MLVFTHLFLRTFYLTYYVIFYFTNLMLQSLSLNNLLYPNVEINKK